MNIIAYKKLKRSQRSNQEIKKSSARHSWPPAMHIDSKTDRVTIWGRFLDQLISIHNHYQQCGEEIVAITANCEYGELFQAGVTREHKLYYVKLRVSEGGVYEYGREEDLRS